jgi:predicted RNA-binding protein with PIN domain
MALLIDGYNLLNVTNIFGQPGAGTALHRARLGLLNFIAATVDERERPETTIVFDAAGAPPGLPRTLLQDDMTIHFAPRHSNADEMIEQLLEEHAAPRSLLVVSSDHRVQRAARRRGASFVDSDAWYRELRAAERRRSAADNTAGKPSDMPSPEDTAYWLRQFVDAEQQGDSESPFPTGDMDQLE